MSGAHAAMTDAELEARIDELVEKANDPETRQTLALNYAAKAETFTRIKNGTLVFGSSPREALETRRDIPRQKYMDLNGPRIAALEEYLGIRGSDADAAPSGGGGDGA